MAELITSIFTPLIWVLAGAGLLKALLAVGVKISPSFGGSTTYAILFAAGGAVFQFMPILLAVTAAPRFKADPMTSPALAGALLYTTTILSALHYSSPPVTPQHLPPGGAPLFFGAFSPPVLAQGGATLAVFLRTRDRQIKAVAGTASISALVAGVTEPAVYGVTLRYKR